MTKRTDGIRLRDPYYSGGRHEADWVAGTGQGIDAFRSQAYSMGYTPEMYEWTMNEFNKDAPGGVSSTITRDFGAINNFLRYNPMSVGVAMAKEGQDIGDSEEWRAELDYARNNEASANYWGEERLGLLDDYMPTKENVRFEGAFDSFDLPSGTRSPSFIPQGASTLYNANTSTIDPVGMLTNVARGVGGGQQPPAGTIPSTSQASAPTTASLDEIIGGLQALPQSQAYIDQAYGGEDIRGGAQGAYYGAPQQSYNVQDIQAAADAIRASGQPLTQGNKVYDTGNPALNEALYGPDISRNISGDGTQGFRTPRQFDPNYVGEFFAAIPEAVATFYGGQVLGAGLGNLADGLLGGSGVAGATTGNAAQAQAVIDNAISNPIFNAVQEFGGQALDAYDTYGAVAGIGNNVYNDVMDNPAVQGGLNGMIVGTDVNGQPIFIQDQELSGGITPQPDAGGGGASSNDTAAAEASQTSSAASGAPLDQALENQDVWTWNGSELVNTVTGETREVPNPSRLEEGVLYNGDTDPLGEETPEEESNAIFGTGNPFINPMTGEGYFGDSVLPTADAELSQGQVLDGNPTEQVAYDPDAVFGSDDPNIDPRTGEAYVDYTTPDNLGGLTTGGDGPNGTGTTGDGVDGDGNDGTGEGPGGDGNGNIPEMTMGMFAGMLGGAKEFEPFQAGINYAPQMQTPQQLQIRNYLAELFGNR